MFLAIDAPGLGERDATLRLVVAAGLGAAVGIGLLRAGAIIREGLSVRGLTTAACLWMVAAIGMASGAGYWIPAIVGTGLTIVALWKVRRLTCEALERVRRERRVVTAEVGGAYDEQTIARVSDLDYVIGVRWRR